MSQQIIILTSTYGLLLGEPLAEDREQERQGVRDGHSQTQFGLADEDEEPDTAGDIEQERHCICRSAQYANDGVEYPQNLLLEPRIAWIGE